MALVYVVFSLLLHYVYSDNATVSGDTCELQPWEAGPWGALLEEWATAPSGQTGRQGRIMALPPASGYYVTDRIDGPLLSPPPPGPPGPRPYDEWQATPPPHPIPGKVVNRPPNPYKDKFKPSYEYPPPQPNKPIPAARPPYQRPNAVDRVDEQTQAHKQVSETDLYLLGAIEKLVYRVDIMEKRLRKVEESLHYLVAGTEKKPDPCVSNFTRVSSTCYHFSSEAYDWKTANLACRKLRANLLELDSDDERRHLFAALNSEKGLRGSDYWTGGLNPGLLWIWSNSARPVYNNTNNSNNNSTTQVTIVGEGRCLALVYDPAARNYVYRGQDCALRHRFVCEKGEDKTQLSNEIQREAKKLKLVAGRDRKPKIMWEE